MSIEQSKSDENSATVSIEDLLSKYFELANISVKNHNYEEAEAFAVFLLGIDPALANNLQFNIERAEVFSGNMNYSWHKLKDIERLQKVHERSLQFNKELSIFRKSFGSLDKLSENRFESFGILVWDYGRHIPNHVNSETIRQNWRNLFLLTGVSMAGYGAKRWSDFRVENTVRNSPSVRAVNIAIGRGLKLPIRMLCACGFVSTYYLFGYTPMPYKNVY